MSLTPSHRTLVRRGSVAPNAIYRDLTVVASFAQ